MHQFTGAVVYRYKQNMVVFNTKCESLDLNKSRVINWAPSNSLEINIYGLCLLVIQI